MNARRYHCRTRHPGNSRADDRATASPQGEELAAKASGYPGQGDGQDSVAVWAAVAQVHATLALAAATAVKTEGDERAWLKVAATPHRPCHPVDPLRRPDAPRLR